MIGYALCGSFCTIARSLEQLRKLLDAGYEVIPIVSENVYSTDTRFTVASELSAKLEDMCGHKVIHTIVDAEPLGPKTVLDGLVICPCTGNTLAKLASGITDTAVCMAAKAHLRSDRPLVISLATNDALSANLKNIAVMYSRKNVYFVPMMQDDPVNKPHSLVANFELLYPTFINAMEGRQYQKIFVE